MTLASWRTADGGIIQATEQLQDQHFGNSSVDLTRTRSSSDGYSDTETDDGTIRTENAVDYDFGIWDNDDVSYSHDMGWLPQPVGSFVSAQLTISAYGAETGPDLVYLDGDLLGSLNTGAHDQWRETVFALNNVAQLNTWLADGVASLSIDKSNDTDNITIAESSFQIVYSTIPEPGTAVLLATGLIALAVGRRAGRARKSRHCGSSKKWPRATSDRSHQ